MSCRVYECIDTTVFTKVGIPIMDRYIIMDLPFYWIQFKLKAYNQGFTRYEVEQAIINLFK
jgi:hypothetical protein